MLANKNRVTDLFCQMTKIYSPSSGEEAFANFILSYLKSMNVETFLDKYGNVIAKIPPSPGTSAEPILLSGHLDVVEPCKNVNPQVIQDSRGEVVVSDGTTVLGADDKAGLAMIFETINLLLEHDIHHGPIELAITREEETGMSGAKNLDLDHLKSKMAFILDHTGPIGQIIVKAPNYYKFDYTFKGMSAHAGMYPELGTNAILLAANAIGKMPLGRIDNETTTNIGLIKGGLVVNAVPDEVNIIGEVRSLDLNKATSVVKQLRNIARESVRNIQNASVDTKEEILFYSVNVSEESQVVMICKKASEAMGLEFKTHTTCGGSDGNVFNRRGIESVVLCCAYHNPHRKDEWIATNDLALGADYLLSIIKSVQNE